MIRSFDDIYALAPESSTARLKGFRDAHPSRTISKEKMLYRLWDIGEGSTAMVFLPGGMGNGEMWFPYLNDLSLDMRCIAFSLPECKKMEDFARQIHRILTENLDVEKVLLVSNGIGGLIGQTYVRMYKDEVIGQILLTCGAPVKGLTSDITERWTSRTRLALRYKFSPFDAMRRQLGYQAFHNMCPEELQEGMAFWRSYISETYEVMVYKKQFINLNCVALPDIYKRLPFEIGDMKDWTGKTLILESEGDQYYGEKERGLLKQLYPDPEVVNIGRLGQFSVMANELELISLMRTFVRKLL